MDRFDDHIRRGGQKAIEVVRAGGRLRFRATIAFEFGPDAREAVLIGNSLSFRT